MKKLNIEQIQLFASTKNSKLLSDVYQNNKNKLHWECEKQHQFYAKWNDVNDGHWCPICAKNKKLTLEDAQEIARLRLGECVSSTYKNCMTKLQWKCSKNHTWFATLNHIKQSNSWCPICTSFYHEAKCREILSDLYQTDFIKQRIYYDLTNKLKFFELDGLNSNLKLAFEYHGKQHFVYPNFWHNSKQEFLEQLDRDIKKRQYCKLNGIQLIEIPYTENETLREYILLELLRESE